jgi:hypothetical protein
MMKSITRLALHRARFATFVLALFCSLTTFLAAQDVASITGVVTDPSGAVIQGVNVTLSNPQTGVSYKATTNNLGSYTIDQVPPGPGYKIEFKHEGFKNASISGLYMNVNATRTQNAQMTLGATTETVEVSAASQDVTLDTTDSTVGNNFQVQFMNDLPVQLRGTPAALFVAQPGVTLDGAVTGSRTDQNRVTVDGLDVNDYATGQFGSVVGNAPVDSVQEFRGVSGGFLSSEAGGGGGQYELVTRSGTNTFHGSLSEYYRDRGLEANDWFNNNAVPVVPRPPLNRNQFGGTIGGPVMKNKLFFFFDYFGRRDIVSTLEDRAVPLDSYRGSATTPPVINYINSSDNISPTPVTAAQVAAFDPQGKGFNPALFDPTNGLFATRYPHANDFSGAVGDLLNTAGFRFNAPFPRHDNVYVERVDFNLNDKQKLYERGTLTRTNLARFAIQFPGDPLTAPEIDHSYSYVIGHVWTISNTKINQASYGETFENYNFPNTYNPEGATQFGSSWGGTGTGGTILAGPYRSAVNQQGRTYPIPIVRDDFSWDKGSHSWRFGGTFKWYNPKSYTYLDYSEPQVGLGGVTTGLDPSFRPSDICTPTSTPSCADTQAVGLYDPAMAFALAPYSVLSAVYNYNAQSTLLALGTPFRTHYRYYETELYFGDTWKVTQKLTLSYGLRWINYSVPYEVNGIESVQNTDFNTYFQDRVAQSAASLSGNTVLPFISYNLAGKANHAPGYFKPQYTNFAPRLAVAYSVNPKTVINAGAGIIFDQTIVNAVQYQESQYNYLFESSATVPQGASGDPRGSLTTDLRFTGLNSPPPAPPAPTITKPYFPYVAGSGASAIPFGLANGSAFNESIDPHLKTPYSITFTAGFEHQLPKGFILRSSYVGRLGRRLLAQVDAEQLIDFKDPASSELMSTAFGNVTQQLRAGTNPYNVTPQLWYENQIPTGYETFLYNYFGLAAYGFPPFTNNTQIVSVLEYTLANRGDFADTTQALAALGAIAPNVGMAAQFSENTFYTNQGFSSYNGLLTTIHKNVGAGLQFDLNYTWSHSIDNVSVIANAPAIGGYGFICDALHPRECRGNSDFDVTQYFNGNFIYDLPFGKGKMFAGTAPRWLDEIIGGWNVSGLPTWHSGNAWFIQANAFVAGYANNAPALLVGPISDLHAHLSGGKGQPLYGFANTTKAFSDLTGPLGFSIGPRNNLRTTGFFDMDMGVGKAIPLGTERVSLKLRGDAFNVFNHPNFAAPCNDLTSVSCLFGTVSSMQGTSIRNSQEAFRVLQIAARLEF